MNFFLSKPINTISIAVLFVIASILYHAFATKCKQNPSVRTSQNLTANLEKLLLLRMVSTDPEQATNYYKMYQLENLTSSDSFTYARTIDDFLEIIYLSSSDHKSLTTSSDKTTLDVSLRALLIFCFGAICQGALNIMFPYFTMQMVVLDTKIKALIFEVWFKLKKGVLQLRNKYANKASQKSFPKFESLFIKWSEETLAIQKELRSDINACLCLVSDLLAQPKCKEKNMKADYCAKNSSSLVNEFAKALKSDDEEETSVTCENCQASSRWNSGNEPNKQLYHSNCFKLRKLSSCQTFQMVKNDSARLSNDITTKPTFFIGTSSSSAHSTPKLFDSNGKPYRRIFVPGRGWISRSNYFEQY